MKLYAIAITTLLILSNQGEATKPFLKGSAPAVEPKNRRLQDSKIEVSFNGIRALDVPGWDPGDEEEWDLEFKVSAYKLDVATMSLDNIAEEKDSFTVEVPENDIGDYIAIDGEVELSFDESLWDGDQKLYRIEVTGTELDESIDEPSVDDPLPTCYKLFQYSGRRFRDNVVCKSNTHEFKVYFRVDED